MSTKTKTAANQEALKNLIIAVLAVNNYPMSEALKLGPTLEERGVTKLSAFEKQIPSAFQIKQIIMDAGYSRGDYVALLLGTRIKNILEAIKLFGYDKFLAHLREDQEVAVKMARSLYGVGPKVVDNFISLQYGQSCD
jgi:hypothetical protein